MVTRLGMIGISEGDGHPFSFSSIINGYDDAGLAASGWDGIYQYVRRRDPSEFGFDGVRVTHAWTQEPETTKRLCASANIPNAVEDPGAMLGEVDGVIIARDDYASHVELAMPFLEAGLHVFVDKPLSQSPDELRALRPYLESGKLMSCSGMRYAKELDEPRATLDTYGELRLVRGAILNSWEQYGVHLLDAIFNIVHARPLSVVGLEAKHVSVAVTTEGGPLVQIDALGDVGRCFRVDFFGTARISSHEITDNFSMFRRTLWHFVESIRTGAPAIEPHHTLTLMRVLMAGRRAWSEHREVRLDELHV
jgi:predicted dehydrogenase